MYARMLNTHSFPLYASISLLPLIEKSTASDKQVDGLASWFFDYATRTSPTRWNRVLGVIIHLLDLVPIRWQ